MFHFPNSLTAAPLNPNYSTQEVAFYLKDTESKLLLVPAGTLSIAQPGAKVHPAVQAARDNKVPLAEVVYNQNQGTVELVLDGGKKAGKGERREPQEDDTALVLHTSGTTGRPKGVPLTHKNLFTTMRNIIKTVRR